MTKTKAPTTFDPSKDWHVGSRTVFLEEGLTPKFFRALENELKKYFTATKNPAGTSSEIFPQSTNQKLLEQYGSVHQKRILGVPLGFSEEMNCADFPNDSAIKVSAEGQLLTGLHEAGHHAMHQERIAYNKYLKGVLKALKQNPNAVIPVHPIFGTPDRALLQKVDATQKLDGPPGPPGEGSGGGPPLLDAHLDERAADTAAALFVLSNYLPAPQNLSEKEKRILDQIKMKNHLRSHNVMDAEHYSTSSVKEVLARYERGEIPQGLLLGAAKNIALEMIRKNINTYTTELTEAENIGLAKLYPDQEIPPILPVAKRLLEESKQSTEVYCGDKAPKKTGQAPRP